MKKHVLALSTTFLASALLAQVPNGGFEDWTPSGLGYDEPDGWVTWNQLSFPIGGSLSCEEVSPGSAGSSCAKITTLSVSGLGVLPGLVFTGDPMALAPGFPYSSRPAALNGKVKFDIPAGDGAIISVSFTKWNTGTNSQDAIGGGLLTFTPGTQSTWGNVSVPITYGLPDNPDTATVTILSSTGSGVPGSTIWVDELSFGAASSVNEVNATAFSMNTTVTDPLHLATGTEMAELTILDLSGRVVRTERVSGTAATVSLGTLTPGMYVARIRFADNTLGAQTFVKR